MRQVSAIIPVYRGEKYIGGALESAFAQAFGEFAPHAPGGRVLEVLGKAVLRGTSCWRPRRVRIKHAKLGRRRSSARS